MRILEWENKKGGHKNNWSKITAEFFSKCDEDHKSTEFKEPTAEETKPHQSTYNQVAQTSDKEKKHRIIQRKIFHAEKQKRITVDFL